MTYIITLTRQDAKTMRFECRAASDYEALQLALSGKVNMTAQIIAKF